MRKVELRMNELEKYEVIKELVDHNGNKNRASKKLGISRRQIDRLIIKYKEKVYIALIVAAFLLFGVGYAFFNSKLSKLNIKNFTFDKVTSSTNMFSWVKSGINIIVRSEGAKEFVSKLNTTANITVA